MSTAAAWGWTGAMSRAGRGCFRRVMAGTSSGPGGGAGPRERINFLTGIALASPLSSPQQPVGQVWYRGLAHQKPDGRSPPLLIIAPAVSPATGGTNSAAVWEHFGSGHGQPREITSPTAKSGTGSSERYALNQLRAAPDARKALS